MKFWKILHRHRCSEKVWDFFRDEKISKKPENLSKNPKSWHFLNLYKELKHSLYKFYKGNVSIPYINSKVPRFRIFWQVFRIFWDFFISKKKSHKFSEHLMSMQNFPRIPKIALRKSCDEFKATKNNKNRVFTQIFLDFNHIQSCVSLNT